MPGIGSKAQRIPSPGGENAQQASAIYHDVYGEMPVPATQFGTSVTALKSDYQPSARTVQSDAAVVNRNNKKDGMISTAGRQMYDTTAPQVYDPPDSSKFQTMLVGPQVNYSLNDKWYIAYPAATVMQGGRHNLAWSERVDQLPTRTTGGPGPAGMRSAPRFKSVQTIPRYSTMPTTYKTQSTQG